MKIRSLTDLVESDINSIRKYLPLNNFSGQHCIKTMLLKCLPKKLEPVVTPAPQSILSKNQFIIYAKQKSLICGYKNKHI